MMPDMRISDIFNKQDKTLSFEFFPPKTPKGDVALNKVIEELSALQPDFISVTYGAGGSTRERTAEIVTQIQNDSKLPAMAHLTCVNATKAEITELLDDYHSRGIENILGLRGDPPEGSEEFTATDGGYAYANELIAALKADGRFSIACAAYPDGHPEAPNTEADWDRFCDKIESGACVGITQCFFDPEAYSKMLSYCQKRIPNIRIIPGIIPIGNYPQLVKFCERCGTPIPQSMRDIFDPIAEDKDAVIERGKQFTFEFCRELLERGAPGLHIYALNKSALTIELVRNLRAHKLI